VSTLRHTLRGFWREPGFALTAILLLAAGIGASCVIFSAMNAVMLRKLPVREPERLFRVVQELPQLGKRNDMAYSIYTAMRDHATTLDAVFGESPADVAYTGTSGTDLAERIRVNMVTPGFFQAIGVEALHGHVLAVEDQTGAVLSYGFWQRRLAGDPAVIGRVIHLHGQPFTVIGVLPREFSGLSIDSSPELRVPLAVAPLIGGGALIPTTIDQGHVELSVRLKAGVAVAEAAGEVAAIWRGSVDKDEPEWRVKRGVDLDPLLHGVSKLRDRFQSALLVLAGAVALLLLMVCANVAGLLLARSAGRRQEIAVQLALGAPRARLIRAMLAEALLLALIGSAAGIGLAYVLAPMLERALPPVRDLAAVSLPLALHLSPDWRVLLFSIALAAITAVLAGLAPAFSASREDLASPLRASRSSESWTGRRILVVAQVALCTLLLAGAGLLIRTFTELQHLDLGVDRDHIVTFTTDPGLNGYSADRANALRIALEERVRALPGVASVAIGGLGLMRGTGIKTTAAREGERAAPSDFLNTSIHLVTPEYFETMGVRLVAGRLLSPDDLGKIPQRVVVNQAFVRRFFPNEAPVGGFFGTGAGAGSPRPAGRTSQIVGVVTDAKYRSVREPMQPTYYSILSPDSDRASRFILHVRTRMRPDAVIAPVRDILRSLDPALPFIEVRTLAEEADATLWSERLTAALATAFAGIAALLAAVGIYGLLAYMVAQRSREIGIRMALGARSANVLRWLGGESLVMVGLGLAIGIAGALAAGPAIRGVLYGVSPGDPLSIALAAGGVLVVALIAVALPIARAIRVDPAITLREEN
jgi:predicted permease